MAGDCTYNAHYGRAETFCPSKPSDGEVDPPGGNLKGRGPMPGSSNFEVIDGLLYRKKLERGFIHYREVLAEDRRHEAISAFHRRRPTGGTHHLSLEETYKCVAENYWWDGMYFQIREHVLGCPECLRQHNKRSEDRGTEGFVSKTMLSHSSDVLSKLRSQREAGLFCDITLHTNGQSYSAHRAVLAAVSEYFQEKFTEMELCAKADIDLTSFSEESLLSLLDFSYSSTLCVRQEDLPEVSTLARHLGMWPAVEACSALQREQEQPPSHCPGTEHLGMALTSANTVSRLELHHQLRERKSMKVSPDGDRVDDGFSLTLDASDESLAESPRRSLRRPLRQGVQGHNEHPLSPTHRMKLMDFKSPSCKRPQAPRNALLTPQSRNRPASSPPTARLLRSSPGAAQEVLKLLPRPESPRRNKKSHSVPRPSPISRQRPSTMGSPLRVKKAAENIGEDEEDYARAQEKYRLMSVLGLQRTALLPRPEDLIGWRQKKRLRKLKANNYSLTKRRKTQPPAPGIAFEDLPLSIPLCNPVNTRFLKKIIKTEPGDPVGVKEIRLKRSKPTPRHVPPNDRSMRSKGAFPDLPAPWPTFGGRELRNLSRRDSAAARPPPCSGSSRALARNMARIKPEPVDYSISGQVLTSHGWQHPPSLRTRTRNKITLETVRILRYNSGRPAAKTKLKQSTVRGAKKSQSKNREEERKVLSGLMDRNPRAQDNKPTRLQIPDLSPSSSLYNNPLYKVIKEEPADPLPVTVPFPNPPSPDRGKRQSKPPVKLLDPGFLFSFYRPAGGAMVAGKREEESVDICLMRSVSQGETFRAQEPQSRVLRTRSGPPTPPHTKRERDERFVSQRMVHRPQTNSNRNNPILAKCTGTKTTRNMPKVQKKSNELPSPTSDKKFVLLESIRRARLKQLRGPCSQAPKALKGAHICVQCHTSCRDCDALIMHSLKHVEGKHWPCPLCSKTFFRLRNVRSHIRNHDQKLYKCRGCIAAAS